MHMGEYIRICREKLGWTQEKLVEELFLYDIDRFGGVDTTTVSKWERGASRPPLRRTQALIRFFQYHLSRPLPCWTARNEEDAMESLCDGEIAQILGSPKHLVARVPLGIDFSRGVRLMSLRGHPRAEELLEITAMMLETTATPYDRVGETELKRWMNCPDHLFTVVVYRDTFLGLFFSLRLKPESFEKVLAFEKRKWELGEEDWATARERCSILPVAFHALTQPVGTLLMARLYAHLLAHQEEVEAVGFVSSLRETEKVAENMGLRCIGEREVGETRLHAYRGDLYDLFASPLIVKSLFER